MRSIFALIFILFSTVALTQTRNTSLLRGHVTDPSGAAIPAAEVTLQNKSTGLVKKTNTDPSGAYSFNALPLTGTYQLLVSHDGFQSATKQSIQLQAGDVAEIDFKLTIAAGRATIDVEGTPDSINEKGTEIDNRLDLEKIDETPVFGRKMSNLPLLDSAVKPARGTGDLFLNNTLFVMNGGGRRQTTFSLDNATQDDSWGRQAMFTTIPLTAVQEFTILTNASSAEYGRTSGGAINVVTKSGTNDLHGDALVLWRPGSIQARAPLATVRTDDKLIQGSAALSGPIVPNKTHFMVSYEHNHQRRDSVITSALAPGVYTGEFHQDLFLARIDHRINDANSLFARANFDRFDDTNPQDAVGGNNLPSAARIFARRTYTAELAETWVISGRMVNEARAQMQVASPITQFTPVIPSTQFTRAGLATEGESRIADLLNHQYQFADTLTFIRGKHSLKAGVDVIWSSSGGVGQEFGGGFTLGQFTVNPASPNFGKPLSQLTIADMSRYNQSFGNQDYNVTETLTGVFLQDDWQVHPKLNLNLGLRYDDQTFTDDRNNFQPRVGFAFRPFGDTVFRGSFGIFDSEIRTDLAAGYEIGGPQGIFTFTATPGQTGFPASLAPLPAFPAGAVLPARDITVRVGQAAYLNQFFNVSALPYYPDKLLNPYTDLWSFGLQHEFSPNVILSVDYLGQHSLKLERPVDLNAPAPFIRTAQGQTRSAAAADATRPIVPVSGGYRRIIATVNAGAASYNGLSANLKTKFGQRFNMLTSYTWSHAINTVEPDVPSQDPNDSRFLGAAEKATSLIDQRHRVSVSGWYQLPWRFTLGSWLQGAAGRPFNILTGTDNNGDSSVSDRPIVNGVLLPRNAGQGTPTFDMSVFAQKDFLINERFDVSLRTEAFDLTNHNNIYGRNGTYGNNATPNATLGAPLGGISNVDPAREIQFQLRLKF